jgi:uncharacterized protein
MQTKIACLVLATVIGFCAQPGQADTIRLMTGPQGGVWVPLGGSLKSMFEKALPGTTVQTLPGAGIANVRGVDEGKAEMGFANSISTADAIKGNPPFEKKAGNVCHLGTLYPQYFQVVVLADAKINSVADLKGRAIAVQPRGNTAEDITRHILQVYGLNYEAMSKVSFVSYTDAVALLKDGHAQAFTLGTTIPASSVMDLASSRDVKLLDLGEKLAAMKQLNPGYSAERVPGGTYPKNDRDTTVIGYATHLIASCKLPAETVYTMLKTLNTNLADLVAVNQAMKGLTLKDMAVDIGVPFHPGASRFYKEAGAL